MMSVCIAHNPARLLSVLLIGLSACGGGGGSGPAGSNPPVGVTPINPASISFEKHYESDSRVSMLFPQSWERQSTGDPEIPVIFLEQAQDSSDQFRENLRLVKIPVGNLTTGGGVSNIQLVSNRAFSIAGLAGEEVIFDAVVAGAEQFDLRFMEISVEFGGFTYALVYTGERARFDRNIDIARHMAARMDIGQIIFSDMASGSDLSTPGKPALASDGTNFFVVSCREEFAFPFDTTLVARFVSASRQNVGNEILIHNNVDTGNTGCSFTRPTTSFDGANFLVTYMTLHDGNRRIVGKRVSMSGQLLDMLAIDISKNTLGEAFEPVTVFAGSQHLVIWQENFVDPVTFVQSQQIRGSFVDTDAVASDSFVIAAALPATQLFIYRPQIALGNNQAMVIWEPRFEADVRQSPQPLYGQLLDLSGNLLLQNPLLIRNDTGNNPRYAQVASDGQKYMIGWIEGLLETNTSREGQFGLYARAVSQAGALMNGNADTKGLQVMPEASDLQKEYLDLSYNNGQFLFLWANASFRSDYGIYSNTVSSDLATIGAAVPIAGTANATIFASMPRAAHPELSHAGGQTLIAWPVDSGFVEGWFVDP